jgi:hypothetical protein
VTDGANEIVFESLDSPIVEFTGVAYGPDNPAPPMTADKLLSIMKYRQKVYGKPLPDGFVPPPDIDVAELLKQLPPPQR